MSQFYMKSLFFKISLMIKENLVRPAGFEPTTPWFEAKCSIH